MKKILVIMAMLVLSATALAIPLSEARAKMSEAMAEPAKLTAIVKQLEAADQVAFLAELNAAIAKMPGSNEQKAAKYLNVNKAVLKGAAKKNLTELLAESLATVPVEVLPILTERYAEDLFSRTADPSVKYTDERFTEIAQSVMKKITARMASMENGEVRSAFGALIFIRASNGTPADLKDKLVAELPESSRKVAAAEWFPAALGEKQEKSYEPMLGAGDAQNVMPHNYLVIRIAGPQVLESLLGDLVEGTPLVGFVPFGERGEIPVDHRNNVLTPVTPIITEPEGYQGQTL